MRALRGAAFALLLLLGLEGALRVAGLPTRRPPDPDRVGLLADDRAALWREIFVHDPAPAPRLRPRAESTFALVDPAWRVPVRINAAGLRMRPIEPARPRGTFRILCLGDDHAFGMGIAEEESYPRRLEARLREAWPACHVEVLNAGVPGATSFQGEARLPGLLRTFDPQVVVLGFGANDARVGFGDDATDLRRWERWRRAHRPAEGLRRWLRGVALYGTLWDVFARRGWAGGWDPGPSAGSGDFPRRVPEEELRTRTLSMVAWSEARGVAPIVLHLDVMQDRALDPLHDAAASSDTRFVDGRGLLELADPVELWTVEPATESTSGGPLGSIEVLLPVRIGRESTEPFVLIEPPARRDLAGAVLGRLRDDGREGDAVADDGIGTARVYALPGSILGAAVLPTSEIERIREDPSLWNARRARRWTVPPLPAGSRVRAPMREIDVDPLAASRLVGHPRCLSPEGHDRIAGGLYEAVVETRAFETHRRRCE